MAGVAGVAGAEGVAGVEPALARLRGHWAGYWPELDLDVVAADVRQRLAAAVRAWGLGGCRALGGGNVALVATGTCASGEPVVVKVGPRGDPDDAELAAEPEALAHWRSTGAVVQLLGARDQGATLLLERLRPGLPLDGAGLGARDRLVELGRLVARLHAAGPAPESLPHLSAWAGPWRRALAADPASAAEMEELLAPAPDDVLLHADLHGGNALRHGGAWRVIDPKGVRGDRSADAWALVDPLAPPLPAGPRGARRAARGRVGAYAGAAGLDPDRVAAWTRLRARAEALGIDAAGQHDAGATGWAVRLHRMADALG